MRPVTKTLKRKLLELQAGVRSQIFTLRRYNYEWIRKQDRQCTCNVILRHVCVTTVTVEKRYYTCWVCFC